MTILRTLIRHTLEHTPARRHVFWHAPHSHGVALTFDDGPDPEQTPRILDVLAELDAHATFFVLGSQVDRYPNLVRRIHKEGHALGNHTYSHFRCPELDRDGLLRQIGRTDAAIEAALGLENIQPPLLFRPPFGELRPVQALQLALRGRSVAFWSRDSLDYRDASVREIATTAISLRVGDVLLLHDRFPNTVEALPQLLETLQRRGLATVTLDGASAFAPPPTRAPERRFGRTAGNGRRRARIDA